MLIQSFKKGSCLVMALLLSGVGQACLATETQAVQSALADEYTQALAKQSFLDTVVHLGTVVRVTKDDFPLLFEMVREVASEVGVTMPVIFVRKGNFITRIFSNLTSIDFRTETACTGFFGDASRVEIGDLLLKNMPEKEVRAVIAREFVHAKHWHAAKLTGVALASLAAAYGVNRIIEYCDPIAEPDAANSAMRTAYLAVVLASHLVPYASRRMVYTADIEAVHTTGNASLADALDTMNTVYRKKHPVWSAISRFFGRNFPAVGPLPQADARRLYIEQEAKRLQKCSAAIGA